MSKKTKVTKKITNKGWDNTENMLCYVSSLMKLKDEGKMYILPDVANLCDGI